MLARLLVEARLGGTALGLHDLAAALAVDDLRLGGAAAARLICIAAAHAGELVHVRFLGRFFVGHLFILLIWLRRERRCNGLLSETLRFRMHRQRAG